MSWNKRQFVTAALDEIGLSPYVYNINPQQWQRALETLDSMMATLNWLNVRVNYPLPGKPGNSDLDQDTGIPDYANDAVTMRLAFRLCPRFGKTASPELKAALREANAAMNIAAARPKPAVMPPDFPAGSGNRNSFTGDAFLNTADEILQAPQENITFGGNT